MIIKLWRKGTHAVVWLTVVGALLWSYIAVAQQEISPRVVSNINYFEGSKDPGQTLDLYLPTHIKVGSKVPLLVWIHGGGWRHGSKADTPGPKYLVDNGYAMASINYRLTDSAKFPAQVEDCKAAIRWLRKHADEYGFDPERIGVFGASAGGHLVAMLGTTGDLRKFDLVGGNTDISSQVEAVCDICGPSDLTTIAQQAGAQYRLKDLVKQFLGSDPDTNKNIALDASPVTYAHSGEPPFLIMHGDCDELVPYEQGKELYAALKKVNVDAELSTQKGGGHGFMNFMTLIEAKNFFDRKLRPPTSGG
jgi:acetyl esterase/lipase